MASKASRINRRRTLKGMAAVGAGAALATGGPITPVDAAGQTATPVGAGMVEPSLYERLGGYFAIAAVVDRFSDGKERTRALCWTLNSGLVSGVSV